jgi:biotin synthase
MESINTIAEYVLGGGHLGREQLVGLLRTADADLPLLLEATLRVREQAFGRRVRLQMLINARSGLCGEDCGYCSQAADSTAPINKYAMLTEAALVAGARRAKAGGATRYCIVTSGRVITNRDLDRLCAAIGTIRSTIDIEVCGSLGLLNLEQATKLRQAGATWANHNLNTTEENYAEICSTHTYQDRLNTIRAIRAAGLRVCSGGIIGLDRGDEDLVELALACREIDADSIPVNFYHPVAGTRLYPEAPTLSRERCLKALCIFRLANPTKEVRLAGGRELHLGDDLRAALCAASALFVEGYLTTPGDSADKIKRQIREAGFEVEHVAGPGPLEEPDSAAQLNSLS